jgi:hypothetical protein
MTGIEVGAAIVIGILIGRFLPNRRKGPKPTRPVRPVCGCEHHHSFHDPQTGQCSFTGQEYRGHGKYEELSCTCRRYSGPVPLPEFYAPEVTSGDSP